MSLDIIKESFGFYFGEKVFLTSHNPYPSSQSAAPFEAHSIILNATNVIGYIPVLSMITAIFRFAMSHSAHNSNQRRIEKGFTIDTHPLFIKAQVFRGVFEFLGCGLLLLIPDLIITYNRKDQDFSKKN